MKVSFALPPAGFRDFETLDYDDIQVPPPDATIHIDGQPYTVASIVYFLNSETSDGEYIRVNLAHPTDDGQRATGRQP